MNKQKDIAERQLEEFLDVYADILNGFLFHGRQVVRPEDLVEARTKTAYKIGDDLHDLERDVAKYWMNGSTVLVKYCIENQSKYDPYITLRGFGYDGADYREQVFYKNQRIPGPQGKSEEKADKMSWVFQPLHPVITLVLYFGQKRWRKNLNLKDAVHFPKGYMDELLPWFNDYHANVIDVCHLTDAQIDNLHSDFRLVAEYATNRHNPDYVPSEQEIVHKEAFFQLLSALEDDERFVEAWREREAQRARGLKGGSDTMGSIIIDRAFEKGEKYGFEQGEKRGFEQGEQRSIMNTVLTLMRKLNLSSEDAMAFLDISQEKRDAILRDPLFLSATNPTD